MSYSRINFSFALDSHLAQLLLTVTAELVKLALSPCRRRSLMSLVMLVQTPTEEGAAVFGVNSGGV